MNKNVAIRLFLFALLISIGVWWGMASRRADYNSLEGGWYAVAALFILGINVLNYWQDKKRGHL